MFTTYYSYNYFNSQYPIEGLNSRLPKNCFAGVLIDRYTLEYLLEQDLLKKEEYIQHVREEFRIPGYECSESITWIQLPNNELSTRKAVAEVLKDWAYELHDLDVSDSDYFDYIPDTMIMVTYFLDKLGFPDYTTEIDELLDSRAY